MQDSSKETEEILEKILQRIENKSTTSFEAEWQFGREACDLILGHTGLTVDDLRGKVYATYNMTRHGDEYLIHFKKIKKRIKKVDSFMLDRININIRILRLNYEKKYGSRFLKIKVL